MANRVKSAAKKGIQTSSQQLDNGSFDDELNVYMTEIVGSPDEVGSPSRRLFGLKVGEDGSLPVTATGAVVTERFDYSSPPVYYVGSAPLGSNESDAVWLIEKFDLTSSSAATGKKAKATSWTGRASGTYT
jgi:hypothetical protein